MFRFLRFFFCEVCYLFLNSIFVSFLLSNPILNRFLIYMATCRLYLFRCTPVRFFYGLSLSQDSLYFYFIDFLSSLLLLFLLPTKSLFSLVFSTLSVSSKLILIQQNHNTTHSHFHFCDFHIFVFHLSYLMPTTH